MIRRIPLVLVALVSCAKQEVVTPDVAPRTEPFQARDGSPRAARHPYTVTSPNGNREDPYYWLRDDSRSNAEVLAYLNAENAYFDAQMAPHKAREEALFAELTARIPQVDQSVPELDHGYWYYQRYEAGKEHPIYCRKKGSLDADEEILANGNQLAEGHAYYSLRHFSVSDNGRYLAYTDDTVGRRQFTLHVKDLETGFLLPDEVLNVDDDIVWAADNKTILYVEKDPETLLGSRVHKHVLSAKTDPVVYEEADHSYYVWLHRSKSEAYVFIDLRSTNTSEVLYADAKALKFKPVLKRKPNHDYTVDHVGRDFIIRTNDKAPNFRVARVPVTKSATLSAWKDLVPGRDDIFIGDLELTQEAVALSIRQGGLAKIFIQPLDPKIPPAFIAADEPTYAMMLEPTPDLKRGKIRYVYTSLVTPSTTYDFDVHTGAKEQLKRDDVPGYDPALYATEFLHAAASDGTAIPVSVAYKKDTLRDGSAPLYQYAYGAYGYPTEPDFERDWVSLMNRGFVVAVAHVRGGQELGRAWYDAGRLANKRNTFTDFVDVTRALVEHRYADRDKVVAEGGSAGGLLMAAVANMAPSNYAAITAFVPFVDVVTTMLDESIPLTSNEYDEWGDPRKAEDYASMLSYSPYDNVRAQRYPAMLVFTGLWDSQVQYYEPAKWVAKLRATKTDTRPLLFHIDMAAGHGGKAGRFERKRDRAREYAFFLWQLGVSSNL